MHTSGQSLKRKEKKEQLNSIIIRSMDKEERQIEGAEMTRKQKKGCNKGVEIKCKMWWGKVRLRKIRFAYLQSIV